MAMTAREWFDARRAGRIPLTIVPSASSGGGAPGLDDAGLRSSSVGVITASVGAITSSVKGEETR